MSAEHMPAEHWQTLTDEQRGIVTRVEATMFYMSGDPDSQVAWLEWQIDEMLKQVSLDDFTPSELVAFVGLVGPIFSRVLARSRPTKCPHRATPLRLV